MQLRSYSLLLTSGRLAARLASVVYLGCGAPGETPGGSGPETDQAPIALTGRPEDAFETKEVPVCWESTTGFATERALVRTSVENTWGTLNLVTFTGWGACTGEAAANSVRIAVDANAQARVSAFGKNLLGVRSGVTLNFSFQGGYASGCRQPEATPISCIHVDAVHEFGHVLGFKHENTRTDMPQTAQNACPQRNQGSDAPGAMGTSVFETAYDSSSVMNYCNPRYWNRNEAQYAVYSATNFWPLSDGDRTGAANMYAMLPP